MREDKYDRTEILLQWIGKGKRVLEIGCSVGYISRLLVERQCKVTGVEIDADAAEQARMHCSEVRVLDLNESNSVEHLAKGSFDVVLLADVLEHLIDPARVLREVAETLTAGGTLVISLPNVVHWVTRAKILLGQFEYTLTGTLDHTHLRFLTVDTARQLIESSGYRITRFHPAIGGKMSGHARWAWQLLARVLPGVFAFQMLFEAKRRVEAHP
jgi:O-antigen biosynthesis protein